MSEIKSEKVKAVWKYTTNFYKTSVINKQNSTEMKLVARVLSLLNITDKNKFLTNSATTIGKKIYLPFTIGQVDKTTSLKTQQNELWHQIVICAHEHHHVHQHNTLSFLYEIPYLTSKSKRARFEAEAYRCHLELHFWRHGSLPSDQEIDRLADKLKSYNCSDNDIVLMKEKLHIWAKRIKIGKIYSPVSKTIIKWLNENAKEIKVS